MQTNEEIEGSADTAAIIFCGLAEMYGFQAIDAIEHLALEKWEYYRFLKMYRAKMMEATIRIRREEWDIERNDLVQKVWIKTQLVRNRINLSPASRVRLDDLPNI